VRGIGDGGDDEAEFGDGACDFFTREGRAEQEGYGGDTASNQCDQNGADKGRDHLTEICGFLHEDCSRRTAHIGVQKEIASGDLRQCD